MKYAPFPNLLLRKKRILILKKNIRLLLYVAKDIESESGKFLKILNEIRMKIEMKIILIL